MSYNKYSAKKAHCRQGHTHDSMKEAKRCNELHLLLKAGLIKDLQIQVPYELIPAKKYTNMSNERAVKYVADFVYIDAFGIKVIEDTKGVKTKEYIIKRKLLKSMYCGEGTVFMET